MEITKDNINIENLKTFINKISIVGICGRSCIINDIGKCPEIYVQPESCENRIILFLTEKKENINKSADIDILQQIELDAKNLSKAGFVLKYLPLASEMVNSKYRIPNGYIKNYNSIDNPVDLTGETAIECLNKYYRHLTENKESDK